MPGYFQPVEISGPKGTLVSLAVDGQFTAPRTNQVFAGMLLGQVYRLRIGNIREQDGAEVYPTVEVISRLHPPPGQETRFPIPIVISDEELALAITGKYITRVIYLENPTNAIGVADAPGTQRSFDVGPGDDALRVADERGRPMAILRMGSRVPDWAGDPGRLGFNYGTPPVMLYEKQPTVARDAGLEVPTNKAPAAAPPLEGNQPPPAAPPAVPGAPAAREAKAKAEAKQPRSFFPRLPAANEFAPSFFPTRTQVQR